MTLPIDLVLVRHGQSEGNRAKRLSEAGDHSAFTDQFRERHTASFRLTDLGREQAAAAGSFIQSVFMRDGPFDRYYVSEYLRAMETAACLKLYDSRWLCDTYLTERNWGDVDSMPEHERNEKYGTMLRRRHAEPFFVAPVNGESFNDLCLRVDRVLDTLHRECSDKRVLIVCHGEVMWAFRVRIERMSQVRFRELHLSKDPQDRIHNCEVIHYSRRDPHRKTLEKYVGWMRRARPIDLGIWTDWSKIVRPSYSTKDLSAIVERTEQLVK